MALWPLTDAEQWLISCADLRVSRSTVKPNCDDASTFLARETAKIAEVKSPVGRE